jgi:hypothetical protein
MEDYTKLVMIMESGKLSHIKNLAVESAIPLIAKSINILGLLQMGKHTIRLTIFW